jgi:hypothetical protein
MSNRKIQELLAKLHDEVQKTNVDDDTLDAIRGLDADIHDLLDEAKTEPTADSVVEQARLLEARFAIEHPTAERFVREMIDTLAKIGV